MVDITGTIYNPQINIVLLREALTVPHYLHKERILTLKVPRKNASENDVY